MKNLLFLLILSILTFPVPMQAAETVSAKPLFYHIDIDKEIGPTTWRYMQKGYEEARNAESQAIILRLNTYGGTVVHADSIRTLILNSPIPVYAFIDNNAASAALRRLCCQIQHEIGLSAAVMPANDRNGAFHALTLSSISKAVRYSSSYHRTAKKSTFPADFAALFINFYKSYKMWDS